MSEAMSSQEDQRPPKRIKITANNGYHILARYNEQLSRPSGTSRRADSSGACFVPGYTTRKAKLSCLPNLPWDVLFEIFGHLAPLDVLHLARTTKPLRRVLMSKTATSVWASAFSNVAGLPRCPSDMAFPSFTNLLFDTHCHVCLQRGIRNVDYHLRVRLCKMCASEWLIPRVTFKERSALNCAIKKCVPFSQWRYDKPLTCFRSSKHEFVEAYNSTRGDKSMFLIARKKALKKRQSHAIDCQVWAARLATTRDKELHTVRHQRSQDIQDRLRDLGWGRELDEMPTTWNSAVIEHNIILFKDHPLVKAPRPLTDKVWRNIKLQMVVYMETLRRFRLEQEHSRLIQKRRSFAAAYWKQKIMPGHNPCFRPGPVDFWQWSKAQKIINSASDEIITQESFGVLDDLLPTFMSDWRSSKLTAFLHRDWLAPGNDHLFDFIRRHWYADNSFTPQLRGFTLAVCVVTCRDPDHIHNLSLVGMYPLEHGKTCMWYPEYLDHPCNSISWRKPSADRAWDAQNVVPTSEISYCRADELHQAEWSDWGLNFDIKASKVVSKILHTLGLDDNTTVAALDKLDARLVCLKCSYGNRCDGERLFIVRNWRQSVQHCMTTHFGDSSVEWEEISKKDRIKAIHAENTNMLTGKHWLVPLSRCLRCIHTVLDPGRMNQAQLCGHFLTVHGVSWLDDSVEYGRDFRDAWDISPSNPPIIKMKPQRAGEHRTRLGFGCGHSRQLASGTNIGSD